MCRDKSRGNAGAQPQYDFPLHTYSLKGFMSDVILPLLYPMLVVTGVMMIGWPGVGKTPALISMGMAMGRHHLRRLQLEGKPLWRRAKSLDNFRHRVLVPGEFIFLDDPNREKIDLADIKSYLTAEEDQTCSGRYNDMKLLRGQRAYAGNHLSEKDEPAADDRTTITSQEMLTLLGDMFPGQNDADTMACLKRAVILVFCKHAVYLRFPSQAADAVVHRITCDDLHRDLLGPHDKYLYADYKRGSTTTGPDFEEHVRQEQAMIHENFLKMESYGHTETYVAFCNSELQNHLRPPPPPPLRHLPSSSSSAESEVPATIPFSVRLASPDAPRKRLLNSIAASSTTTHQSAASRRRHACQQGPRKRSKMQTSVPTHHPRICLLPLRQPTCLLLMGPRRVTRWTSRKRTRMKPLPRTCLGESGLDVG